MKSDLSIEPVMTRKRRLGITAPGALAAWLAMSSAALAHTGVGEVSGFAAGFWHPLGGLDHLLAMLAVGLWAAQIGGKATWQIPCAFVGVMVLGSVAGMIGLHVPMVEQGILASVLVLGALVAVALRCPAPVCAALAGLFALFHGHAHGTEMPLGAGALAYVAGFSLATALLHGAGIALAALCRRAVSVRLTQVAGGAIVLLALLAIGA